MNDGTVFCPRLIEVALPIREISAESVRDKSLRHGHISTLHLWWARRPLAASRAVVFASLVPDPDDPACPADFRDAVTRLLRDDLPPVLKSYWRGRKKIADSDPYRPYDSKEIPDTPRNRLLTFIAKWSPEWLAFEGGENPKQPPPAEMLDDRSLVKWETSDPTNEQGRAVLRIARELVRLANGGEAPVVLDPFSGGGAIPLEAGRLGCQPIANDYNPVAYLILRATCEYPQKYGMTVEVAAGESAGQATGAPTRKKAKPNQGQMALPEAMPVEVASEQPNPPLRVNRLARDVEYWARWILERARAEIGGLYPPGQDGMPVVGYLWARTAPCSNPSCRAEIPLLRSLLVCDKPGKRVALTVSRDGQAVTFGIAKDRAVTETDGTMLGRGDCRCPICGQVTPVADLRRAGLDGKMGERMVAVITDTPHGKGYRPVEPTDLAAFAEASRLAELVERPGEYIVPEINAPGAASDAGAHRSISVDVYGLKTFGLLFGSRQLLAMQSFVGQLHTAMQAIECEMVDAGYRNAIVAYLGLWVSRIGQRSSNLGVWHTSRETLEHPFGRQALPMTWDYPEGNPFSEATGGAEGGIDWILRVIEHESGGGEFPLPARVFNGDGARLPLPSSTVSTIATDPPYFDAVAYADLSDFFYIWLKRGIGDVFPEALATPQTPKSQEVVAHKHRHHGNREQGKHHFQYKLTECLSEARRVCKPDGTIAIMFAHQSTEAWTALVGSIFASGLTVTATYPIDTEMTTALKRNISALESSITVICRRRETGAAGAFRDVRREIEKAVSESVHRFWDYGFRGADLIVACYGPAVGVFGRYERVERADGTPVGVPELLQLVRESALKAIAGELTGDPLSRLYFVWANLYGTGEQAWDDARLVIQVGGDAEDAMEVARRVGLFVVDGATCRLALLRDRAGRRNLGVEPGAPLIDRLHHALLLWKTEQRDDLLLYLRDQELIDDTAFWKLAQALFEVLPRGEEDWKLVSVLLGERETLRSAVRRMGALG